MLLWAPCVPARRRLGNVAGWLTPAPGAPYWWGMRVAPLPLIASIACGAVDPVDPLGLPADDSSVAIALAGLSPEALLDLVEDPRLQLAFDPFCGPLDPSLARVGPMGLKVAEREVWTADCLTDPDVVLEGSLVWTRGPDQLSLVGDRAVLWRNGEVEFALDGAIEAFEQGELLLLDAAATWCGPGGPLCDADALTVDLSFSLFPASAYPAAYDVTVTGAVGSNDALVSVEGAWSIDSAACPEEPTNGALALRGLRRHALDLDGAERCDGCAGWAVPGQRDRPWCALDL